RSLLISTLNEGVADNLITSTEPVSLVYPNPSTQNFYLEGSNVDQIDHIRVFTSKGDEVSVTTVKDYLNRILIDMTGHRKGLYHLQYQLENQVIRMKLILI
ncbi:MAG: T9SS type A sorting domain-containing protein, partial [Bacteroidota bacterium]